VNPYLGQTGETLAETGARLGRVSGVPVTMPREVYKARIEDGTITDQDILDAIAASADAQGPRPRRVKTMARAEVHGPSRSPRSPIWPPKPPASTGPGIIAERFGHWAAAISTRVRRSGPRRGGGAPMTPGGNTRPMT
jgi:hypothetical protein